jgi:hypothetical protein
MNRTMDTASNRNEIFQSFWHGGYLSPLAWLTLTSFAKQGHRVELYSYETIPLPEGVHLKPADEIVLKEDLFYIHDTYSTFANLFRYKLLMIKGNWWTDTDVLCTGQDIPTNDIAFAEEEEGAINNALIKLPPNHPISREALAEFSTFDLKTVQFGQTGADLLTRVVKRQQLDGLSLPRRSFYPLHWLETYKFISPEFADEVSGKAGASPFVHFWNYMFRFLGFDTARDSPPTDSFLDAQYRKHGIYDVYDLRDIKESELRVRINAYIGQDWPVKHARLHGLMIPQVRIVDDPADCG